MSTILGTETALSPSADADEVSVDPSATDETVADGPQCEKCEMPLDEEIPVCRHCGFYPRLNTFVELEDYDKLGVEPKPPEPFRVPMWACALAALFALVIGESILATRMFERGHPDRAMWSFCQLILGLAFFGVGHVYWIVKRLFAEDVSVIDMLLNPFKVWAPVCKELPKTQWWVSACGTGLVAALMSLLVIGGIYNDDIWGEIPGKRNRKPTVVKAAPGGGGGGGIVFEKPDSDDWNEDMTLEEAVSEMMDVTEAAKEDVVPKDAKVEYLDCVVVGYHYNKKYPNRFQSVVVAHDVEGEMKILGNISEGFSEEQRAELLAKMRKIRAPRPFVATQTEANWVKPLILCRIRCVKSPEGQRQDFAFDGFLADFPLGIPFLNRKKKQAEDGNEPPSASPSELQPLLDAINEDTLAPLQDLLGG